MKRKLLLVAMTALVALGLIAPAVNADVTGIGTLQGFAEVGQHFRTTWGADIDCNKDTVKDVHARGQGLYLPPPMGPEPKNGVWSLHAIITAIKTPAGLQNGTLDACGFLTHTVTDDFRRHGPACGISKGHSGIGQVNFVDGGGLNLFDLQWKIASSTVPMIGKYQVWNGTKGNKNKQNKWGNMLALFQAQGGQRCAEPKECPNQKSAPNGTPGCGAQSFTVIGAFQLLQPGDRNMDGNNNKKDDVFRPKDNPDFDNDYQDGPLCKDDGGDFGTCQFDPKKGNGKETPKSKPTG